MRNLWKDDFIRNAVNTGYGGLKGDNALADRVIGQQARRPRFIPLKKSLTAPALALSMLMIVAAAFALVLMSKPAAVSEYGLWRYTDGQLTYQGEEEKRPRIILEDENIRFIAADDQDTGVYYITREDGQNRLKNMTTGGFAQTPGRIINRKYDIVDLQVSQSTAYILANSASAQGQVVQVDPYGTYQEMPVSIENWENERITAFAVYQGVLYAYKEGSKNLAVIDLSNRRVRCEPVQVGGIFSLTAGQENAETPFVLALTRSEASGNKRLLILNALTGEMRDTGETVPDWADYVSRNREELYLLGTEQQQVKSLRISALSGTKVLHELYIVNGGGADEPVMQAAIQRFRQRYPDVELVFRNIEDTRVLNTELMAGEGGIDVFGNLYSADPPGSMLLQNGVIRDLTGNPDIQKNWEDWRDLKGLVSADGRQFAVLRMLDLYAFAVSGEWADKIGWSIPDGPWSLEEFEALIQKAEAWNRNGGEHLYLLCDSSDPYFLNQYETSHVNVYAGTADFETEAYLRLLRLYEELNEKELLYPREKLAGREEIYDYLLPANSLLRVTRGSLSWMNQAERVIFPPSPQGEDSPYLCTGWYLYANSNSRYPEEAEYFLACYGSAEAVSREFYENYGQWLRDRTMYDAAGAMPGSITGRIREETERVFNEAIVRARPVSELRELFWQKRDMLPALFRGEISAEAFAAAMQQQAEMMLGE